MTRVDKSNDLIEAEWGALRIGGWKGAWLSFCHSLPPLPGMRRIAMWIRKPMKILLRDWIDVTVWGLRLRLLPEGNLSEQRILFLPQFFDRAERLAIADTLASGGVFVDIGANIGAYSLWVASLGNGIRIEAFEPDSELCKRMQFNLSTNGLDHVHIHPIALGNRCGTSSLKRNCTNRGRSRVVDHGDDSDQEVRIEQLPDFLQHAGIDQITALKIDVEGDETSVLEPLLVEEHRNVWPELIVCEIEKSCHTPDESAPWKLLIDVGYELQQRTRLNGIFRLPA
jgi:FkbM family methyltransferase